MVNSHGNHVSIQHLNVWYGERHTLKDISFSIPRHRITAILGPSGCGKSTFLRTLNRLHETTRNARVEGTVLLDDRSIFDMDVTVLRRNVGMVFQKSNPFPKSIFDNVAFGLRVNGLARRGALHDAVERSL
ncbi:MAG: ATP-binding cassette domain-containing protein, partial [Chloroflexi bacterium]